MGSRAGPRALFARTVARKVSGSRSRNKARSGKMGSGVSFAHARRAEADEPQGIAYRVASAVSLPFADGSFDAEPRPSDEKVRECSAMQHAQVVSYFLHVRARKPN